MSNHNVFELWGRILHRLRQDKSITPQGHGYLDLVNPKAIVGENFYLEVPNEFTAEWLEQRLSRTVLNAIEIESATVKQFFVSINPDLQDTPPIDFSGELNENIHDETDPGDVDIIMTTPNVTDITNAPRYRDARLNAKFTFDSYVIGPSNRFAHASAFAVAESPAKGYNPLFIYGDSGLGKTHLLHAIGNYSLNLYENLRVLYVSSEAFTNDFINSVATKKMDEFRSRYRSVDILLVDDIQFLQGKLETLEAFFHTFNDLYEYDKQVVITSDVAPKDLTGFEDRMRSRFSSGLMTDVQAPDLETRMAILQKKASANGILVPREVIEFMASKVSSNIRELEGVLHRVTAFASLSQNNVIDLPLAQAVLRDLITDDRNVVIPAEIVTAAAEYFSLSVDELAGSNRSQAVAFARQVAMYLCRDLTNLSLPKIGQLFGNRDHTTVMYATRKIGELMKSQRSVYDQVTDLTSIVKKTKR